MRKKLLLLFLALLTTAIPSMAAFYSFTAVNSQGVKLTYYKTMDYDVEVALESNKSFAGNLVIPGTVTDDSSGGEYSVIGIYFDGFKDCVNLTGVTFLKPEYLSKYKDAGEYHFRTNAFENCTSLKSTDVLNAFSGIHFVPTGAFKGCTALTSVTLPSSVEGVMPSAFEGCTGITNVSLGNAEEIENSAFKGCTGLTQLTIPNSVAIIRENAFADCTNLTEVNVGTGLDEVYRDIFKNCNNISKVNITDITAWSKTHFQYQTANPLYIAHHLYLNGEEVTTLNFPETVSLIGEFTFAGASEITSVTIPAGVKTIEGCAFYDCPKLTTVNYNATEADCGGYSADVGYIYSKGAFNTCPNISTINIGNNVTVIPKYLFRGCTGVTSVTIPNSVVTIGNNAFLECTGLENVTIGNSVTTIEDFAFMKCSALTSVTIPYSVTSIGTETFSQCTSLASATIGNSVTTIGAYAFYKCTSLPSIVIPNSVTTIDRGAFSDCTVLANLTLGSSITTIGEKAFNGCSALNGPLSLGNSIASIGDNAFNGCTGLTKLTLGNSVHTIGKHAFYGCTGLTELNFGNAITSIDNNAFDGCHNVTKVNIPDMGEWCNIEFGNYPANPLGLVKSKLYLNDVLVEDLVIPSTVNTIGAYAFVNGTQFTSLSIPNSVTRIGYRAFEGCTNLTGALEIPNSVTILDGSVFWGCTGLTSVTIPESMEDIYDSTFYGCKNLKTVYNFSDLIFKKGSTDYGEVAYYADNVYNLWRDGDFLFDRIEKNLTLTFYEGAATDIVIPASFRDRSVTAIAADCFQENTSITSVSIPNTVTEILANSFSGCTGLVSVSIPESVTSIYNEAFMGCSSLETLVLPNSLTWLGERAFQNNTSLVNLRFGTALTHIPQYAFSGCTALKEVVLPSEIKSLSSYAFQGCSNITSLSFGCNIMSIGYQAFDGANSLTSVSVAATSIPRLDSGTFTVSGIPLYVPEDMIENYKNERGSPWSTFDIQPLKPITKLSFSNLGDITELSTDTPVQLETEIEPADPTLPHIFWRSTDPTVATVDANGKIVINPNISDPEIMKSSAVKECKIIAETMYADGPTAEFSLKGNEITVRTIGSTGYQTLYYSDRSLLVPDGISAWVFVASGSGIAAQKEYPSGSVIPAGEAVVLYTETPGEYAFKVASTGSSPLIDNCLKGTDAEQEVTASGTPYILANGSHGVGFYQAAPEGGKTFTNGAHKAYLDLPVIASAPGCLTLDLGNEEGGTSGIGRVILSETVEDQMYNVLGQPVDSDYKGFVIRNGRIYINK